MDKSNLKKPGSHMPAFGQCTPGLKFCKQSKLMTSDFYTTTTYVQLQAVKKIRIVVNGNY